MEVIEKGLCVFSILSSPYYEGAGFRIEFGMAEWGVRFFSKGFKRTLL